MKNPVIDLTWGNADYLVPYWEIINTLPNADQYQSKLELHEGMSYEREGGREELKEAIRDIHNLLGNAVAHDKHIIIGNGATQLLIAAMTSLNEMHDLFGCYIRKPHYMRFNYLVAISRLIKINEELLIPVGRPSLEICTVPNNPDNAIYPESTAPYKIHDLCYNWPQYMKDGVQKRDDDIMIFSMAKATGHAGSRIGWALVRDPALAEMMAYWVELTSNGVSVDSQVRATTLLKLQSQFHMFAESEQTPMTVFQFGNEVLNERWAKLLALNNPKFKLINNHGMFAMIEFGPDLVERDASVEFAEDTGILGVPGDTLGAPSNQIRLNIGCSEAKFNALLIKLNSL